MVNKHICYKYHPGQLGIHTADLSVSQCTQQGNSLSTNRTNSQCTQQGNSLSTNRTRLTVHTTR